MADNAVEDILAEVHEKGFKPFESVTWGFGFDLAKDKLEAFEAVRAKLESRRYEAVEIGEVAGEELLLGSLKKSLPCNAIKLNYALKELNSILEPVNSKINQFAFLAGETSEMKAMENEVKEQLLSSVKIENIETGETLRRKDGVFQRVSNFFSKKGK
jgi:hypothetical protein